MEMNEFVVIKKQQTDSNSPKNVENLKMEVYIDSKYTRWKHTR